MAHGICSTHSKTDSGRYSDYIKRSRKGGIEGGDTRGVTAVRELRRRQHQEI